MEVFDWTSELAGLLIMTGLAFATIGYLIANTLIGKKNIQLTSELAHKNEGLAVANTEVVILKKNLSDSESKLLEHIIKEEQYKEQLKNEEKTHERLYAEIAKLQANFISQQESLELTTEQYHASEKNSARASAEIKALNQQEQELRQRLTETNIDLKAAQQELKTLTNRHSQLKTELEEREASHKRELANFEKQKQSLSEQFKVLSNDILEVKSKSLQESNKLTLSSVMSPFQQSIDSFKKEVQEIHHRETTQQGELRKELASLKELNKRITTEAHELSTALRGQKKLQGNWGELVLENVLDRSGLQMGKDYQREVSVTTEEGRQRPDAVVYLPQQKHLIIDAKVSLNAYTRFVNSDEEIERSQALKDHVQAIRNRIKELSDRDYYKLPGFNSPEMVFMFVPIESAFVEALKSDETLFQQAIENNVLVATPTTLLTSLNIVRQLWRYEDQNKHTAALAKKAEAVFKKLNSFLSSFEKVKKGLDTASSAYINAENQLISGKGNLVKQVGEFKNLAPAIKAELPTYFTEKATLEIDYISVEENKIKDQERTTENVDA